MLSILLLDVSAEDANVDLFSQSEGQRAMGDEMTFTQTQALGSSSKQSRSSHYTATSVMYCCSGEPEHACSSLWKFSSTLGTLDVEYM